MQQQKNLRSEQDDDPALELWLNSVKKSTRVQYRTFFKNYQKLSGKAGGELLKSAKHDENWLAVELNSYKNYLQERGLAPNTVNYRMNLVRSFYSFFNVQLPRAPRDLTNGACYEPDVIYPIEKARMMYSATESTFEKSLLVILAKGQRIEVLRGLKVGMLSNAVISVPSQLLGANGENCNKGSTLYRFPVGVEDVRVIKEHLEERRRHGEQIRSDSLLVISDHGRRVSKSIAESAIYRLAERAGVQEYFNTPNSKRRIIHPHGFRRSYKSWIREAWVSLKSGYASDTLLDFIIGHKIKYGGAYDKFSVSYLQGFYKEIESFVSLTAVGNNPRIVPEAPSSFPEVSMQQMILSLQNQVIQIQNMLLKKS